MGYEDVDYGLRAWQAGYEVAYVPSARLYHHESATRGTVQGERELASQRVFWERWAAFFGDRPVLTDDGRLRVVYVTEGTIVGGGHRDVFEHLNGLADRGHDVALWTLEESTRLVRAALPRAHLHRLRRARRRRSRRSTRSRSRRGGTPPPRCGAPAWCTASRCTSSRTSRPATTPTLPSVATRCSTRIARSSASSRSRAGTGASR